MKLFREEDGEVFALDRDLTIPSAADDLIREVGHVDILIANLAYPHKYAPAHQKSDEDMEYAMQRLFCPLHRLTRAVLPQMLERKRGKIVVVGSADSLHGRSGGVALYGGARAAQLAYMRHVAMEVAPHVNVNATAQSYVENPTYFPKDLSGNRCISPAACGMPCGPSRDEERMRSDRAVLAGPESDFFYGQTIPFAGGWTV